MKRTIDEVLYLRLKAIPKKLWITGRYHEGDQACVMGHLGIRLGQELQKKPTKANKPAFQLDHLFGKRLHISPIDLNNAPRWATPKSDPDGIKITGNDPKTRIMNGFKLLFKVMGKPVPKGDTNGE